MTDSDLIGYPARVSALVTATDVGEVIVSVRGGTEAYLAYSARENDKFDRGEQAMIMDVGPGRVVYIQ